MSGVPADVAARVPRPMLAPLRFLARQRELSLVIVMLVLYGVTVVLSIVALATARFD